MLIVVGRVEQTQDILRRRPAGYGQSYVPLFGWIAVMHYYYSGVAMLRHGVGSMTIIMHLASRVRIHLYITILIIDAIHKLKDVDKMSFSSLLGTPFHPYELFAAVLRLASKDNIPSTYHMCIFFHIHFHPLT